MSNHYLASVHAHRIASDSVLLALIQEVFGRSAESIARYKAIGDHNITQTHAANYADFEGVPGEFVKQNVLHSLDLLFGDVHQRMVKNGPHGR